MHTTSWFRYCLEAVKSDERWLLGGTLDDTGRNEGRLLISFSRAQTGQSYPHKVFTKPRTFSRHADVVLAVVSTSTPLLPYYHVKPHHTQGSHRRIHFHWKVSSTFNLQFWTFHLPPSIVNLHQPRHDTTDTVAEPREGRQVSPADDTHR